MNGALYEELVYNNFDTQAKVQTSHRNLCVESASELKLIGLSVFC